MINFKIYNHELDRAITFRELEAKVKANEYDLIILEDIEDKHLQLIENVAKLVKTCLVCGRALEYSRQVEMANSIGIDIVEQTGALDDYVKQLCGVSTKFRGIAIQGKAVSSDTETVKESERAQQTQEEPVVVVESGSDGSGDNSTDNDNREGVTPENGERTEDGEADKIIHAVMPEIEGIDDSGEKEDTRTDDVITEEIVEEEPAEPAEPAVTVIRENVEINGVDLDEIRKRDEEIAELKSQISSLNREVNGLRGSLNSAETGGNAAENRIKQLEKELDTRRSELDAAKGKADSIASQLKEKEAELKDSIATVATLTSKSAASESELEASRAKVAELEGTIATMKESASSSGNEVGALTAELGTERAKVAELEKQVEALEKEKAALEGSVKELNEKVETLESDKRLASIEKESLEKKISELEGKINELNSSINSYVNKTNSLQAEVDNGKSQITALQTTLQNTEKTLSEDRTNWGTERAQLKGDYEGLQQRYTGVVNMIVEYKRDIMTALKEAGDETSGGIGVDTADPVVILGGVKKIADGLVKAINESRSKDQLVSGAKGQIDAANAEKEAIAADRDHLRSECSTLRNERDEKNKLIDVYVSQISQLNGQIGQYDVQKAAEQKQLQDEVDKYKAQVSVSQGEVNQLRSELAGARNYSAQLSDQLVESERAVSEEKANNERLEKEMEALKQNQGVSATGGTISMNRGYNGRAKIIQVIGSGSYGTTTTAMTIAQRFIGRRVLYLDLDLVSPKADSWFNINPVCDMLTDIQDPLGRTGVAALIEQGTPYVIRNYHSIVKHKINQGNYVLDYFSGTYKTPLSSKIYTVDYSLLFNFIGNDYDYIVVDSGRLGSSDVYDSVIRTISEMAYKNVVVTTGDKFEIRTQRVKIDYTKIPLGTLVWVVNMSNSNVVGQDIKKIIGPTIKIVQFMRVPEYFSIKRPLDIAVPMLKPKVDELMHSVE